MSDYGLNFGFRRSEPSVREGRLRVPAAGDFFQGDLVTYDSANPGFLKKADADTKPQAGFVGLLVQEEGWDQSYFAAPVRDSNDKGKALNGKPAVIQTGPGNKVWLRNTEAQSRFDGRSIAGRAMFTGSPTIGAYLKWDGSKWVSGTEANGALRVTLVGDGYLEAVLLA